MNTYQQIENWVVEALTAGATSVQDVYAYARYMAGDTVSSTKLKSQVEDVFKNLCV